MQKVTIYDAASSDRISIRAWKVMFQEMWEYRELTHRLVLRNIAGQFRQSFLGYLWIALPPIATTLIFALLRRSNIVNVPMPEGAMPYALFVLVNTTIWQFFTQLSVQATGSITAGGALVSKIYFPREVLVLSQVGTALINLAVQTVVIVATFAFLRYIPHWQVVLAPLFLLPVLFFALGIGMILAPINAMMNDISRLLSFAFQFGMFLTPTVYPTPNPAELTTGWQTVLYWCHTLNPVSHFINATDAAITGQGVSTGPGIYLAAAVCMLILLIGWRFLHICEPLVAERL